VRKTFVAENSIMLVTISRFRGRAKIRGRATIRDWARIRGRVRIRGHARNRGRARICRRARIRGRARKFVVRIVHKPSVPGISGRDFTQTVRAILSMDLGNIF
jgi:hypothetical protein